MSLLRERDSPRFRAALRGLLPAILTLVGLLAGLALLSVAFGTLASNSTTGALLALVAQGVLYAALIYAAVRVAAKLERSAYAAFGLNVDAAWLRDFAVGVAVTIFGIVVSLAWAEFRGLRDVDPSAVAVNGSGDALGFAAVVAVYACYLLLGNVYEEVVYRRIAIKNFANGLAARGLSPTVAVAAGTAASLVLFGAFHVPLRGNVIVAVDAALVGVTFSLAYILTGDLGLSTGVHFGRLPTVFMYGVTIGGFEVTSAVTFTPDTLAANLEVKLVRLGVICLGILAWSYHVRGEIRVAESVHRQRDRSSDAA